MRYFYLTIILLVSCGKKNAPAGPPPGGPPEVSVVTVKSQRVVLTTELPGRVAASLTAEVRPQVGGIIQQPVVHRGGRRQGRARCSIRSTRPPIRQPMTAPGRPWPRPKPTSLPLQLKAERYQDLVKIKAVSQQDV